MGIIKLIVITVATAVGVQFLPLLFQQRLRYELHGHVEPGFELVEDIFKQNFDNNWDKEGAGFAACHEGKMVVDLWGGYAEAAAGRKWREDTMSVAFSSTKMHLFTHGTFTKDSTEKMTFFGTDPGILWTIWLERCNMQLGVQSAVCALLLAVLVDRGLVRYDDLVVKYWPEFTGHGKDNITVRMLASHEAGLAALDEEITFELVKDWQKMSRVFEKQIPNWQVGSGTGYHMYTYGWLVDQLFRRIDPKKRSIGQFLQEEIAIPHSTDLDFHIGLPNELHHRVARLTLPSGFDILLRLSERHFVDLIYNFYLQPSDSILKRIIVNPRWISSIKGINVFNNPELHNMEVGAANGIGTARSLAGLFCLLDSDKLISKSTLETLMKPVWVHTVDNVIGLNVTWGYGFWHTKNPDGNFQLGHPGYGGQNVKYDPHYRLSFAYLRNGLAPDFGDTNWSFRALQKALYDSLKKKEEIKQQQQT